MFRKPLTILFKKFTTTRTLGLSTLVGLSLMQLHHSFQATHPSPQPKFPPPSTHTPLPQISLPQNQSYYLIVYDPAQPQTVDVVKSLLSKQKQQLIFLTNKQYESITEEQLSQPVTIFYKGDYLPYKIKLDLTKGDIISQAKNIQDFVVTLDSAEDLQQLIKLTENSFQNPLLLINVFNQEGEKVLKTQIIALTELHLLNPLQHKIHIIRHGEDPSLQNTYHIMKNDILSQLNNSYQLQTFTNPPEKSNQEALAKARVQFIKFLLPRIHTVRDVDDYLLYQQRTTLDKQKYTISIKINPHDKNSEGKLKILKRLHQKYQDEFNFVVFATSKFKSFLVHTHKESDDFVLFNPDKKIESSNIQQRPTYQKIFLGNYEVQKSLESNAQRIEEIITQFLNKTIKPNQLNVIPTERHFEINNQILSNLLKTKDTEFILGVCSKKCLSSQDYSIHNIGINKETYLLIDTTTKTVSALQQ